MATINEQDGKIVAAAISSAATVFVAFLGYLKWYLPWRLKQKKRNVSVKQDASVMSGITKLHEAYSSMYSLVGDTTANRVILFAGHNSGGIPSIGSPFYISAIHWFYDRSYKDRFIATKNLTVDAAYLNLLIDLKSHEFVTIDVAEYQDCQLKEYHQLEGVKHAVLCFVGIFERQYLYLSAAKYVDIPFTPEEVTRIKVQARNIGETIRLVRDSQA